MANNEDQYAPELPVAGPSGLQEGAEGSFGERWRWVQWRNRTPRGESPDKRDDRIAREEDERDYAIWLAERDAELALPRWEREFWQRQEQQEDALSEEEEEAPEEAAEQEEQDEPHDFNNLDEVEHFFDLPWYAPDWMNDSGNESDSESGERSGGDNLHARHTFREQQLEMLQEHAAEVQFVNYYWGNDEMFEERNTPSPPPWHEDEDWDWELDPDRELWEAEWQPLGEPPEEWEEWG